MSDFGDDDPYTVDRGYKTDSYIMAVSGYSMDTAESSAYATARPVQPVTTGKELLIQEPQRDYGALGPEDVEYYRTNSFWRTCRWSCVVCCILLLILLILLTVYSLLIAPRCIEHKHDWWEKAVIYEIWTPSFRDSDMDGKGDFIGISQKLKNIRRLGVSTLYIKPFISHSDTDGGAVDDFDDVAHELGNLKEAVQLIEQAHDYGFKVIIDFPVSATSTSHPWFLKSSQGSAVENQGFADFYFWKKNYQPNEFISTYGSNGDVYYHIENKPELAVLNFKEPNVSSHIKKSLFDWIQRGVDGFHLRYVDYLARTQDGKYPNWNGIVKAITDIKKTIRTKLMEREDLRDRKIFFFASMDNIGEMEKLRLGQKAELDAVLNTELLKIAVGNRICEKTPDSISDCTNEVIGDILQFYQISEDIWPMWQFGNSETERLASRTRSRLQAELLQMVQLLLPGTPIVYYGDMVGAKEVKAMDHPQRSAMAWDDTSSAGFSDASVFQWTARLPSEWKHVNFEKEVANPKSRLRVLKRLIQLKSMHDILFDGQTYLSKPVQNSFSLCRFWNSENDTNKEAFVLSVNFGSRPVTISIHDLPPFVYAQKHMNLASQPDPYLEARILAVSSAVHPDSWYKQQKFNIASGQLELGVDQGILYRFYVT